MIPDMTALIQISCGILSGSEEADLGADTEPSGDIDETLGLGDDLGNLRIDFGDPVGDHDGLSGAEDGSQFGQPSIIVGSCMTTLQSAAVRLLSAVIEAFATVSDPYVPSQPLLQQFQSQLTAALLPLLSRMASSPVQTGRCLQLAGALLSNGIVVDTAAVRGLMHHILAFGEDSPNFFIEKAKKCVAYLGNELDRAVSTAHMCLIGRSQMSNMRALSARIIPLSRIVSATLSPTFKIPLRTRILMATALARAAAPCAKLLLLALLDASISASDYCVSLADIGASIAAFSQFATLVPDDGTAVTVGDAVFAFGTADTSGSLRSKSAKMTLRQDVLQDLRSIQSVARNGLWAMQVLTSIAMEGSVSTLDLSGIFLSRLSTARGETEHSGTGIALAQTFLQQLAISPSCSVDVLASVLFHLDTEARSRLLSRKYIRFITDASGYSILITSLLDPHNKSTATLTAALTDGASMQLCGAICKLRDLILGAVSDRTAVASCSSAAAELHDALLLHMTRIESLLGVDEMDGALDDLERALNEVLGSCGMAFLTDWPDAVGLLFVSMAMLQSFPHGNGKPRTIPIQKRIAPVLDAVSGALSAVINGGIGSIRAALSAVVLSANKSVHVLASAANPFFKTICQRVYWPLLPIETVKGDVITAWFAPTQAFTGCPTVGSDYAAMGGYLACVEVLQAESASFRSEAAKNLLEVSVLAASSVLGRLGKPCDVVGVVRSRESREHYNRSAETCLRVLELFWSAIFAGAESAARIALLSACIRPVILLLTPVLSLEHGYFGRSVDTTWLDSTVTCAAAGRLSLSMAQSAQTEFRELLLTLGSAWCAQLKQGMRAATSGQHDWVAVQTAVAAIRPANSTDKPGSADVVTHSKASGVDSVAAFQTKKQDPHTVNGTLLGGGFTTKPVTRPLFNTSLFKASAATSVAPAKAVTSNDATNLLQAYYDALAKNSGDDGDTVGETDPNLNDGASTKSREAEGKDATSYQEDKPGLDAE
jgi:hypothetical protein